MIDTHTIHQSAKISWIRRLFQPTDAKWKTLIDLQHLNKNCGTKIANKAKSKYHTQILQAWYPLLDHSPTSIYDILNQYIANNQYIKMQGKSLTKQNFQNLKIYDFVNEQGTFLTIDLLNRKLECKIKPLHGEKN